MALLLGLAISPANPEQYVDLGAISAFPLTVTNGITQEGIINVAAASSERWEVTILDEDGEPLADSNDDGLPDVGELERGESVNIVAEVRAPMAELAFVDDETTITVTHADSTAIALATLTSIVNPKLVMTIDSSALPAGDVVASSSNIEGDGSSLNGNPRIAYVARHGIAVTVMSNGMWLGSCAGQGANGTASPNAVVDASLNWRLSGSADDWVELTEQPNGRCFPNSGPGVGSYAFDLELELSDSARVEDAQASITFDVSGARDE